jgi:hypothetical protein
MSNEIGLSIISEWKRISEVLPAYDKQVWAKMQNGDYHICVRTHTDSRGHHYKILTNRGWEDTGGKPLFWTELPKY